MLTIHANTAFSRLEDLHDQIDKSWPSTLQKIIRKNPFPDDEYFYVYTFPKWNFRGDTPVYDLIHQVRRYLPDPFWGTSCQRIHPKRSVSEVVWTLPHKEGINNYAPGKMFHDKFVWTCIQRKNTGLLDRYVEEENERTAQALKLREMRS
jgi:hypothetical protein